MRECVCVCHPGSSTPEREGVAGLRQGYSSGESVLEIAEPPTRHREVGKGSRRENERDGQKERERERQRGKEVERKRRKCKRKGGEPSTYSTVNTDGK